MTPSLRWPKMAKLNVIRLSGDQRLDNFGRWQEGCLGFLTSYGGAAVVGEHVAQKDRRCGSCDVAFLSYRD